MKLIYRLFLYGLTFHSIARELTASGVPTPGGKKRWSQKSVESILTNEKYKGDALLQKSFTVNFLTKEKKQNEGEVPQYYVENDHEAIISPQVFVWVQEEIERRHEGKNATVGYLFSPVKSSVASAAAGMGPRSGIPLIDIAGPSSAVMISSRIIVRHHILQKRKSNPSL